MRPTTAAVLAGVAWLASKPSQADPTWPAPTDEIEEIVYQLHGFQGRLFADTITPCGNEASGPGRQDAAEWLRLGFHDMSTANRYFGTGGLDASLQYELLGSENLGPGHANTLQFLSNYHSARASMADLIAAGVYAAVRACGGPVVPLRLGRVDALAAGPIGVPQPQNSLATFTAQFDRMGFNLTEMVQLTACGHTLGGVHATEFPDIVPLDEGSDGEAPLDATDAVFDNAVVTEYLAGNATNPLAGARAAAVGKDSDARVFDAGLDTLRALADPAAFRDTCRDVLARMIEVVPAGVTLSSRPLEPYAVKPVAMQLTLNSGGLTLGLSGYIRFRATGIPVEDIAGLTLAWKDRDGGDRCGSAGKCEVTSTPQGAGGGFDDRFFFFPILVNIDASAGISSFTVTVNYVNGTRHLYDNNGHTYPMSDAILLQKPQSCLIQGTGALSVAALVRNDRLTLPVTLHVSYHVPHPPEEGNPVPALHNATVPMSPGDCYGDYTFFRSAPDYAIPGGMTYLARLDVVSGDGEDGEDADVAIDAFKPARNLAGTCLGFAGRAKCVPASVSASSTTSTTTTAAGVATTDGDGVALSLLKETVGGYRFVGCYTEGRGVRALGGAAFAYDGMTLETCMRNCTGFANWGVEFGRECYCGNGLGPGSVPATAASECDMPCAGDKAENCGAGNRLALYSTMTTATTATTATALARSS